MNSKVFIQVMNDQIAICEGMLGHKAAEYATDDERLHNFKVAATLQGVTPRQALAGFMAKHTVSIYDLCAAKDAADLEVWTEKITDHMNYLILLKALVVEELLGLDKNMADLFNTAQDPYGLNSPNLLAAGDTTH